MIAFVIALPIIAIALLVYITSKGEGDLTLLFYERFGKHLDALEGQVVWITGASSGIGEGLAYVLAKYRAKLVLSARNVEALQQVKTNCLQQSKFLKDEDVLLVPFDIGDYTSHDKHFKQVLNHFRKLDILVNNAGRTQRANFQDIEIEVHEQLFRTNTFGPVMLTKAVLPYFIEKKAGHIVVTSSSAGILGAPFSATYTGTKHALHGFFETLRIEVLFSNINITMVCPGPVESKIVENASTGKLGEFHKPDKAAQRKAVKTSRCAKLMACAIVNKLDQVWISGQPVLMAHYLSQYMPSLYRGPILKKIFTLMNLRKIRDG